MGTEEAFEEIQDILDPTMKKSPAALVELIRQLDIDARKWHKVHQQQLDRVRRHRERKKAACATPFDAVVEQ